MSRARKANGPMLRIPAVHMGYMPPPRHTLCGTRSKSITIRSKEVTCLRCLSIIKGVTT